MLPPAERFSDRVEDYIRSRPSYPAAAIDCLCEVAGLNAESVVADIGCGTGIFAVQLLATGASVVGVEPNEAMRNASVDILRDIPKYRAVAGTAEETGLEDQTMDLITAAQAFHWFRQEEARAEFRRILKPTGWVALIWNERKSEGSPFAAGYEQVLRECSPEYALVGHRNTAEQDILTWFQNPQAKNHMFVNETKLDIDNFLGRAYSSSYVPAEGTAGRVEITRRLVELFQQNEAAGLITIKYETKLFLGQLQPNLNRCGS